jgi:hypothetical protein
MPIVPSRSKQIQELIGALSAARAAERESAIARLTLVGERAVSHLVAALRSGPATAGTAAAEALVRIAAAGSVPASAALREALADPKTDPAVRQVALDQAADPPETGAEALLASLPEGPEAIPALHAMLGRVAAGGDERRGGELAVRLHEALAARGSRIALYELRERLEARPVRDAERLLKAASAVADATFVPTLARLATDVLPLVPACAKALRAIVRRESLKKSHRSVKAVRPEHRAVFESLWSRARR